MKKILALIPFLVLAAACATAPTENTNTANANSAAETKPAMPSEADIVAKEKAGWDAIKKKDWDGLSKMLTSDFIDVESDGAHDKASSIAGLKDMDLTDVSFADWKLLPIDKDALILTYKVTPKVSIKGKPVPDATYYAAAGYVNRDGQWLGIYFQQTQLQPMPPPKPGKSPSPKPAPTTTGKMADAGPDVVADEKLVWDALRSRNFDAFAGYLASDSMEIEPDGVYDKAGSVKGVSMLDFSKAEASEWKTVKFDNDASLVTYVVKVPGMKPDTGHHSTVWINRNGKWMALFHQGTPVMEPEKK